MRRTLLLFPLCLAAASCDALRPVAHENAPEVIASTEKLAGDVLLTWRPSTGDLVVAVDTGSPSGPDGRVDRFFVLQRRDFVGPVEPLRLRHATVTYQPGLVLVEGERGHSVALLLQDTEHSRALAEVRRRPVASVWAGYGLARKSGNFAESLASLDPATLDRLLPVCGGRDPLRLVRKDEGFFAVPRFQTGAPPETPLKCDSGGSGSAGCSTACADAGSSKSCSVNCGTGFHACCDMAQCKCQCVRN